MFKRFMNYSCKSVQHVNVIVKSMQGKLNVRTTSEHIHLPYIGGHEKLFLGGFQATFLTQKESLLLVPLGLYDGGVI